MQVIHHTSIELIPSVRPSKQKIGKRAAPNQRVKSKSKHASHPISNQIESPRWQNERTHANMRMNH
jgi:hypothetical protein